MQDETLAKLPSIKIAKILHRVEDSEFISGMVVSPSYSPLNPEDLYGVVLDSEEFGMKHPFIIN